MTDVNMRILLSAAGGAGVTSMIGQIANAFSGPKGMVNGMKAVGLAAAAIGVTTAIAIGVQAVKAAGDFQQGLTTLSTGAGELQSNLGLISDGVLNMAVSTGTSTKQLTDGLFMIESAGYHGQAGLDVLKTAAQGARVGNADLGVTADAVTTIMKDYGIKAANSADAMNFLTSVVSNGKTHLQDLASSMSAVLPTAGAVGVQLIDVGGAMATMTGEGVPAANAATYLRQMLISLSAPASAGAKSLKDIGLSTQQVSDDMKKSLPDTLKLIMTHLGETYQVGSPQYVAALKNISGGSKQMQGMLDLTGSHLKDFQTNVGNVSGTMNQGKGSVVGWSQVQGDFNFKMSQAKEMAEAFSIKLGTALMPIASGLVTILMNVATWLGNVANFFQHNEVAMDILKGVLIAAAGVILGVVIPAFIGWAIAAWGVAAGMIATAAPFLLIILLVGLLIAVVMLLVSHWQQVEAIAVAVWGHIVKFFQDDVAKPFQNALKTLGDAFNGLKSIVAAVGNGIGSAIKGGINAVIDVINGFIGFIDSLQIHIPSIGVGPIHSPAFNWNGLGIPKIPHLETGGTILTGGWAVVGENGPELANLPGGSTVYPNGTGPAGSGGHVNNFYISINTMARSQSEVRNLVTMIEQELGRRVRAQTPNYNQSNVF